MARPRKNKDSIKKIDEIDEKIKLERKLGADSHAISPRIKHTALNLDSKNSEIKKHEEKHELYVEISPDRQFALCDGKLIKDPKELAEILKTMNDNTFDFHVNEFKNDFANWIDDIFDEKEFADEIREIHNKIEMRAKVFEHLFKKLEHMKK